MVSSSQDFSFYPIVCSQFKEKLLQPSDLVLFLLPKYSCDMSVLVLVLFYKISVKSAFIVSGSFRNHFFIMYFSLQTTCHGEVECERIIDKTCPRIFC
jgi:hypothetical protein